MARKALLIGAQTNGLAGVENDVDAMDEALSRREFTIRRCTGEEASRAGILAAYEQLIAETGTDDSVFVYYSGHGGRLLAPPDELHPTREDRPAVQFIVPNDLEKSTEGDFRGITAATLSSLLALLTARTGNVAVMLDCCHSALASRKPDHRVKALHYPYEWAAEHVAEELTRYRGSPRRFLGNDLAVRLVACAPEEVAFEHTTARGPRMGMFTEAFVQALQDAGDLPVAWSSLMDRVRRAVLALTPEQRPEAEGPASRVLFGTQALEAAGALRILPGANPERITLQVAPLLGVKLDDEFAVMPAEATEADPAGAIATAVVDRAGSMEVHARLTFHGTWTAVPPGARAFQTRSSAPSVPVGVPDDPRAADLVLAIGTTALLRTAVPGETTVADVRIDDDGGMTLCDRFGPLHPPRPADGTQAGLIKADLVRLARAARLRELREDPGFALPAQVTVGWGRIVDGVEQPLRPAGEILYRGDRVFVRIANDGDQTVYVSLVDIGVGGEISLQTRFSPSGIRLDPKQSYVFGLDDLTGRLEGVSLTWPDGVETDTERPETLLILTSERPQDLSVLEQDGVHAQRSGTAPESPLEQLVRQIAVGGTRAVVMPSGPQIRYTVRFIDFDMSPVPAPTAEEVAFAIDDRPDPSVRLFTPRGAAPERVAVRLGELVVHRNRAVFGADVRVDAVVLTGGSHPGAPVYTAQTQRFSNVRDGDRLPLDKLLVYHGPATDFLDIAVFVSRDSTGSLELSDLMRAELGDAEVQGAAAQLAGLALAAPQAALAVASVAAGAVVVNVAYKLLRRAVGDSIGLYRTSLLAHERFGAGRHPADGSLRRAQDFSFSFTVEAVA
ncbi:caspase family protein [Dactylosporangium sp. NBC_01737]|uniref:caspase family protein n=1 Tax=Dactylosporangium sp. NBC_01737 TaxID=2975959 RepID=UPI002E12F129|nr:caspase family protein [Dactylosporangium sp. NBC_01737]